MQRGRNSLSAPSPCAMGLRLAPHICFFLALMDPFAILALLPATDAVSDQGSAHPVFRVASQFFTKRKRAGILKLNTAIVIIVCMRAGLGQRPCPCTVSSAHTRRSARSRRPLKRNHDSQRRSTLRRSIGRTKRPHASNTALFALAASSRSTMSSKEIGIALKT